MEKLNDYFCIKAFGGIEIRANGNVAMCCDMQNRFVDTDNDLNLHKKSLDDIIHSPAWTQIRQNMLDNCPSAACTKCYENERVGIKSQRQNSNNRFTNDAYFHAYNSDSDSHRLIDIDMKIGNVCNQMCVICDSASSSMLYNEDLEIFGNASSFKDKYWRNPAVWNQIVEQFNNVKLINIYGGEPLLIKEVKEFLARLVDKNFAKNIEINFATNGSIYDSEFFDILDNFKRRNILMSADGHKQVFEYSRYPANWDQFFENLHKIKSRLLPTDFFGNAYTYNIYSVFDLVPALEFYKTQLDFDFPVWLNPVNQSFYAINALPKKLKKQLTEQIEATYNTEYLLAGSKNLKPIVNSMHTPMPKGSWQEFVRITKQRDKIRGVNVLDVIPELEEYWHEN